MNLIIMSIIKRPFICLGSDSVQELEEIFIQGMNDHSFPFIIIPIDQSNFRQLKITNGELLEILSKVTNRLYSYLKESTGFDSAAFIV